MGDCVCGMKWGISSFSAIMKKKDLHPIKKGAMPYHKIKAASSFYGEAVFDNIVLSNFNTRTKCGAEQHVFYLNEWASDFVPVHTFYNTIFSDVEEGAMPYIYDPKPKWANPDDCIDFPCTAPSNVLLKFENTMFAGSKAPLVFDSNFQIISDTDQVSENFRNCERKTAWNAWLCSNDRLGIFIANALDDDFEDRSVQPVYITGDDSNYNNKLNSFMDHVWDGFYTGQKHKSMFPAIVELDKDYTVEYSGTPFKNMEYAMRATNGQSKIRVLYWDAGSYEVYVNDVLIEANMWDRKIGKPQELTGNRGCGENRFVGGVDNYLEFIITAGCVVEVRPIDSFPANVRMDWTLDEFYQ